ncbi:MAG: hypothetical protein O3C40_11860 [Planctomycetota bacterium]|nr:hypothetical protein [Planctomycetota bacterium]
MNLLFRLLVLTVLLASPALFVGCAASKITSDEIPTDIGDVGEDEGADANPPEGR